MPRPTTPRKRARGSGPPVSVVACRPEGLRPSDACGVYPLRGLLTAARAHGLSVELLDLRNSGDTAGPRDRVVGYGAFAAR